MSAILRAQPLQLAYFPLYGSRDPVKVAIDRGPRSDGLTDWPAYGERYLRGEVSLEVFLRIVAGKNVQDLAAVIHHGSGEPEAAFRRFAQLLREREAGYRRREQQRSVFVSVPHALEDAQRIVETSPSPPSVNVVWLTPLDVFLHLKWQELHRVLHGEGVRVLRPVREDRKEEALLLTMREASSGCTSCDLEDGVIERRAEIVNGVTDDQREFGWRLSLDDCIAAMCAGLRIEVAHNSVRVALDKVSNPLLERAQMFLRPDNFRPGPVQWNHA